MALFPPERMGGSIVEYGYKGKGNLLHLLTDGEGRPLYVTITAANGNERLELPKLLDQLDQKEMSIVEADKGYDSKDVRIEILKRGYYPLIAYKGKKKKINHWITRVRWKVERTFSWLKRGYRRVATRWERLHEVYEAFLLLALCMYWVRKLVG